MRKLCIVLKQIPKLFAPFKPAFLAPDCPAFIEKALTQRHNRRNYGPEIYWDKKAASCAQQMAGNTNI